MKYEYRETIIEYLEKGYGATDFRLLNGGKHVKLEFMLSGKRFIRPLNEHNTTEAALAMQDIRRKFGDPRPQAFDIEKRIIAELDAECAEQVISADGHLNWSDRRFSLHVPPEVIQRFGGTGPIEITGGPEEWILTRLDDNIKRASFRHSGKMYQLDILVPLTNTYNGPVRLHVDKRTIVVTFKLPIEIELPQEEVKMTETAHRRVMGTEADIEAGEALRKQLGLSETDFSVELGFSKYHWSNIIKYREITRTTALAIAGLGGYSPSALPKQYVVRFSADGGFAVAPLEALDEITNKDGTFWLLPK